MNFTEEQLRGQYNLGFKQGYAEALNDVKRLMKYFHKYHFDGKEEHSDMPIHQSDLIALEDEIAKLKEKR